MRDQWEKPTEGASRGWAIRDAADVADVYLYDVIDWLGVTAQDFVPQLAEIKAPKITLHINSPGGDVFDAMAIHDAIRKHPAEVTSRVEGIAASAASFIALAANRVLMAGHSTMMIHDPIGLTYGNAEDHQKQVDVLNQLGDEIASIYAEKADKGTRHDQQIAKWRSVMKTEAWYTDQGAVDAGLADAVDNAKPAKATNSFDPGVFHNALAAFLAGNREPTPTPPDPALLAFRDSLAAALK